MVGEKSPPEAAFHLSDLTHQKKLTTHCILHLKFGKVKILCPNKNLKPAATVHV